MSYCDALIEHIGDIWMFSLYMIWVHWCTYGCYIYMWQVYIKLIEVWIKYWSFQKHYFSILWLRCFVYLLKFHSDMFIRQGSTLKAVCLSNPMWFGLYTTWIHRQVVHFQISMHKETGTSLGKMMVWKKLMLSPIRVSLVGVNIDSGYGLVPAGTKPLPELMMTQCGVTRPVC